MLIRVSILAQVITAHGFTGHTLWPKKSKKQEIKPFEINLENVPLLVNFAEWIENETWYSSETTLTSSYQHKKRMLRKK